MKTKAPFRLTALLLAALMLLSLVACGNAEDPDDTVPGVTEDPWAVEDIYPNLPDGTYYDHTFTFISSSPNWGGGFYIPKDLTSEGYTGDSVNDATYERNQLLKKKYGFDIANVSSLNCAHMVKTAVKTGDATYDAIIEASMNLSGLMFENYLYNLYDLPNLDLTKSWWDQSAVRDLTFNGALYIVVGDMVKLSYSGTSVMFYNKSIAEEEEVEDLYQLVRDGKWTFDKMLEIAIAVTKDLDGDQRITNSTVDRVGLTFGNKNHMAFFYGANQKIATIEGDNIRLTMNTERTNEVAQWLANIRARTDGVYVNDDSAPYADPAIHSFAQVRMNFVDDRVMFTVQTLNTASDDVFVTMDEPAFGILPLPKYNEEQQDYYTFLPYDMHVLAVPNYVEDPARTGAILEAMCAYSTFTTKKAAYDDILITRESRSEENEEMINLIQKNRIFDLGYIFNWGECRNLLLNSVHTGTNTFKSTYDANEDKINSKIESTLETIRNPV